MVVGDENIELLFISIPQTEMNVCKPTHRLQVPVHNSGLHGVQIIEAFSYIQYLFPPCWVVFSNTLHG